MLTHGRANEARVVFTITITAHHCHAITSSHTHQQDWFTRLQSIDYLIPHSEHECEHVMYYNKTVTFQASVSTGHIMQLWYHGYC